VGEGTERVDEQALVHESRTEAIAFWVFRPRRDEGRRFAEELAQLYGLRVESIEERGKLAGVELTFTVTGDPFKLIDFREGVSGREDRDPEDGWFETALGALGALAKSAAEHLSW
jgi:hypothetical protein